MFKWKCAWGSQVCRILEPVCFGVNAGFSEEVTVISKVYRLPASMYSSSVTTQLDLMSYWASKRLNNSSDVTQLAGDCSWLWTQTPSVSLVRASSCASRSLTGHNNGSCNKMEEKAGTKGFLVCMSKLHCLQVLDDISTYLHDRESSSQTLGSDVFLLHLPKLWRGPSGPWVPSSPCSQEVTWVLGTVLFIVCPCTAPAAFILL